VHHIGALVAADHSWNWDCHYLQASMQRTLVGVHGKGELVLIPLVVLLCLEC
jgi:hypothetical protein